MIFFVFTDFALLVLFLLAILLILGHWDLPLICFNILHATVMPAHSVLYMQA